MPTPAEAAQIFNNAMQVGFDPIKARLQQQKNAEELRRNLELEAQDRADSYRTGRSRTMVSGATNSDLEQANSDLNESPNFGVGAQKRQDDAQARIDAESQAMSPEAGAVAQTKAKQNAFATFMNAKSDSSGKLAGQTTPEGKAALDADMARKLAEELAKFGMQQDAKPLSANGEKTVQGLHEAVTIGQRLHQLLTEAIKNNPQDVAAGDSAGGSEFGAIASQLPSVGAARLKKFFYDQGVVQPPSKYDEITRLADQLKVYATSPMMGGMRNMKFADQIQSHLTNGKLPNAANLERLEGFLKTAPDIEQSVYDTEHGKSGNVRLGAPTANGQPSVGTRKTFPNGKVGVWDGTGWAQE